MKFAVVLLALVSVAFSAPQPRKAFHEHIEDFLDLIMEEVGDELGALAELYIDNEEFQVTLDYLRTNDFKDLVYEMEDLPEFKAVQDFLDTHSVDITFIIDSFNDILEADIERKARQSASGRDFNSFVRDATALFPQEPLAALFDQKLAEFDEFRAAIEGIQSDEFSQLWDALWESSVFQAEIQTLADNGVDFGVLLDELMAIFGQGRK